MPKNLKTHVGCLLSGFLFFAYLLNKIISGPRVTVSQAMISETLIKMLMRAICCDFCSISYEATYLLGSDVSDLYYSISENFCNRYCHNIDTSSSSFAHSASCQWSRCQMAPLILSKNEFHVVCKNGIKVLVAWSVYVLCTKSERNILFMMEELW